MRKFVCISTVALLVAAPVPVMSFAILPVLPLLTWLAYFGAGVSGIQVLSWVKDEIVGEIIYTESEYPEITNLWYYGYYKNIQFWNKRSSVYDPVTKTTAYWTWTIDG